MEGGILAGLNDASKHEISLTFAQAVYTKEHLDYVVNILAKIYRQREITEQKAPISFKIAVYEPISLITLKEREARLKAAGLNPFRLQSDDIAIDILTDSGTGAMSLKQWSGMLLADEAYAGSRSFRNLERAVRGITGFKFVLPTHQGRGAESVLGTVLIKQGNFVIANLFFDTTAAHIQERGGQLCEVPVETVYEPSNPDNFKGNIDLKKLEQELTNKQGNVAYVLITATNNTGGGVPVSMQNMRLAREICRRHQVLFFLDGARFLENAQFIKELESGYQDKPVKEIVKEMCSYFDGMLMSSKKDAIVNIGGFIAVNDQSLYERLVPVNVLKEGFPTYGGQAGYTMESLARGLYDGIDEDYLRYRLSEIRYLANRLRAAGIPIVEPVGGHAVFVDAGRFLPHIPKWQFPAQALANALYLEAGIRAVEIGSLLSGRDPATKENRLAANEYLRLTIPRRVYLKEHLDYIADALIRISVYL